MIKMIKKDLKNVKNDKKKKLNCERMSNLMI